MNFTETETNYERHVSPRAHLREHSTKTHTAGNRGCHVTHGSRTEGEGWWGEKEREGGRYGAGLNPREGEKKIK